MSKWIILTLLSAVRLLREELQLLHEPGSYVGEVVKVMGKTKVLVKVQPEGKYSEAHDLLSVHKVNSVLFLSCRPRLGNGHVIVNAYSSRRPTLGLIHDSQNSPKQS